MRVGAENPSSSPISQILNPDSSITLTQALPLDSPHTLRVTTTLAAIQLELKSIEAPHPPSLEELLSNPRPPL